MAGNPGAPDLNLVNATLNTDIAQLVRRCERVIVEMQHAQSASVTMTIEADRLRIEKYIRDVQTQLDTVNAMGIPDVPETMPEIINLSPQPDDIKVTNDDFYSVIQQWYVLRDELVNSQSSRLGGGLLAPDYKRAKDLMTRIETLFSRFIPAIDPGDYPESTPNVAVVGPGHRGI